MILSKKPELEFLFQIRIPLMPPIDSGQTPNGHRMILIAETGVFEGPELNGIVLPRSGGDWAIVRPDGSGVLDVRLSLKTTDGSIILMTYSGRMISSEENFGYALDFQKPDDPEGASRYYFRTNPVFETANNPYKWLNDVICIGTGRTGDNGVIYDIYKVT